MIPGLQIDPSTEERVWRAFTGWAEHFLGQLRRDGIPGLLHDYERHVVSVETKSCTHDGGRSFNRGVAYQEGCGDIYEYTKDLAVRDALQIIMDALPHQQASVLAQGIIGLDQRLKAELSDLEDQDEPGLAVPGISSKPW